MASDQARWRLELWAVEGATFFLRIFPPRLRLATGSFIGRLGYALDKRHREVALQNLEAACPGRDASWREGVARGSFRHLGRLLVEILSMKPEVKKVMDLVRIEGWQHLQRASCEGKGYFLVSGHFGNWEMIAHLQGALGYPLWMITRPLDNPLLESFLAKRREGTGNRVVHKRNAVREIVRGLKAGKGVAFVIDQNFGEEGRVFVPFFGRPASTTPALGSLAVRLNVTVLPVFAFPEPSGRYRIVYGPPVEIPDGEDREKAALEVTARATARIEEAIRACPEAWFWMHRRWRTRPEDAADSLGEGDSLE